MQSEDRGAFAELLQGALAFYGQEVTPFALGVWWRACQGVSLEQVREALTAHAMDPDRGHFPPKPADIVRVLHGTQSDRSLVAWGKVLDAMQRVGAYASVDFGDPVIHCAIEDAGGWPAVCRTARDELPFLQRRFCDAYRAYSLRGDAVRPAAYLPGVHEVENRAAGRPADEPVRLGAAAQRPQLEAAGFEPRRVA